VLRRDGSPVAVMPKVFDLLVTLVRGRGLLLTKEELMRQVWPATYVDEGSLARTVSRLRSLLGETGRGGPLETVSKSGYRFVADVHVIETADTGDRSLAILPFSVVGPKSDESGDLGLGIADALITRLTLVRSLRVRPTSAVLALGGLDAIAAGRTLRVDAVLQGRLQLHGDVARTTVQLVSVAEERPVWAESFDESIDDIYRLQDSIASRIVAALSVPISGQEAAFLKRPATTSAEAGRIYQQARALTYRFVPGAWHRAIALYEVATELDPSFAAAHAGLASAYSIGAGTFAPTAEASAKAHAAIERALRLDDSLPEAWVTLGSVRFWLERDVEGGEAALRRGLAVSPNDVLAHHFLSWQLAARGRFAEASLEIDRAAELDPTSTAIAADRGLPAYFDHRPDEALGHFRKGVDLDPAFWYARYREGFALLATGAFGPARAAFDDAFRLSAGSIQEARVGAGVAAAALGETATAEAVLHELLAGSPRVSPYELATLALALGRHAGALDLLERALELHDKWVMWIAVDPRLDSLREHPRFEAIREAIGIHVGTYR
jgi:serine/threonine-protein kinase